MQIYFVINLPNRKHFGLSMPKVAGGLDSLATDSSQVRAGIGIMHMIATQSARVCEPLLAPIVMGSQPCLSKASLASQRGMVKRVVKCS